MKNKFIYAFTFWLFFPVSAFADYSDCQMFGWGSGMMGGGFLGGVLTLILWVLIIIGLFYLIKFFAQGAWKSGHQEEDAVEILKRRYAKGEINKQEFEQMKKELSE